MFVRAAVVVLAAIVTVPVDGVIARAESVVPTSVPGVSAPTVPDGPSVDEVTKPPAGLPDPTQPLDPVGVVVERSSHTTTYLNPDGSKTTHAHSGLINFWDELTNEWKAIDARVVPSPLGGFQNTAGPLDISFAAATGIGDTIRVKDKGWSVAYSLEGARTGALPVPALHGVTYKDVLPKADLEYLVLADKLKETIVLRERGDWDGTFRFPLRLDGVTVAQEGEDVVFRRGDGVLAAKIPPGTAYDGTPDTPPTSRPAKTPVAVTVVNEASGAVLQVNVDRSWLEDPARVYPVRIDPTFSAGRDTWANDITVGSKDPNDRYWPQDGNGNFWDEAGWDPWERHEWNAFTLFDIGPAYHKRITVAKFNAYTRWVWQPDHPLWISPALPSWYDCCVSFNNRPGYHWPGLSVYRSTDQHLELDITSYVTNWANDTWQNWGFYYDTHGDPNSFYQIRSQEESYKGSDPWLQITWEDIPPALHGEPTASPGSVQEGQSITFSQAWSHPYEQARLFVCSTSAVTKDGCLGRQWAASGYTWSSPASAAFPSSHADIGTHDYYAFVCTDDVCSEGKQGTFSVTNKPPQLTGPATDSPDPVNEGATIRFEVPFSDVGTDRSKAVICKTNAAPGGTCETGQTWAIGQPTAVPPARVDFTIPASLPAGTKTYYAFACDDGSRCSTSSQGTFTVNKAPSINPGSTNDAPDPVTAGSPITFSVAFDDPGDTNRAVVCKTNAISATGVCPGGSWATGSATATSPAQAAFTPDQSLVRAAPHEYWAFVCDSNTVCSASASGSFVVQNATPVITGASDAPDPTTPGNAVVFTVDWTDGGGDSDRAVICKTNAVSGGTCTGGQWAAGTATTSGQSTASFTPAQADVGTHNYFAFACDGSNACSLSRTGTFTVSNLVPTNTSTADAADPAASGSDVTFSVGWTDSAGDAVKAVICKTDAASNGACAGGAWAIGTLGASSPAAASLTTSDDVLGTHTYYAFACDAAGACSSSRTGTFTVTNNTPSITSVVDAPDPVTAGNPIDFRVDWADVGGSYAYTVVCKTNAINPDSSCPGGAWATSWLGAANPAVAMYTTAASDAGTRTYYAFVCDGAGLCSASSGGTFVVNAVPTTSAVSDAPDPAVAGSTATFSLSWSDAAGDSDRAVICKTNAIANGVCTDGEWARGALGASSPSSASLSATQAMVGTQTYYAFACDSLDVCSAGRTGTFTVTNATPVISTATDGPDPVTVTGAVTFTVSWTDGGGDPDRAVICKTNSVSAGTCPGGVWATGALTAGGSSTASYTAQQGDVGTNTYYAFACDAAGACSASRTGTFTVNNGLPAITSVSDSPDPLAAGAAITFSAGWSDTADTARVVVCKTNAVSASATCPGGAWATGSLVATSPATVAYATTQADVGSRTYYAFICDSGNACTSSLSGSFSVTNVVPTITGSSDAPDPVVSGSTVTFTATWTDAGGDAARAVVCKTNAVSGGTCPGGTWAAGGAAATGTSTATYAPTQPDVGSRSYWIFACDTLDACSASRSGSFTVANATPAITGATDSPDPVTAGSPVTFTVTSVDPGGDGNRAVVCKTNAISAGACTGGAWAVGASSITGSATATYTTTQADVGSARPYYAFACDSSNACSASTAGSFTVMNATPSLSGVTDSPDPVTSGANVTFTVTSNDPGGDADRAVVCKTNAVSAGGCTGGTWAVGTAAAGGTSTAEYTTTQADVGGARTYYAFACDAANACSPGASGTFTVANATPTVTNVTAYPAGVASGQTITFSVAFADGGGDADRAVICKTNAISAGTCSSGTWARGASLATTPPATAAYTTTMDDVGAREFWAFACDADGACSTGVAGSFTVEASAPAPPPLTVAQSSTTGLEDFYAYEQTSLGTDELLTNLATGDASVTARDFGIPGPGLAVGVTRTYNRSLDSRDGPLGYGWSLAITGTPSSGLGRGAAILASHDQLAFDDADGTRHWFVKDGPAGPGWHSPLGVNLVVTDVTGATGRVYTVTRPDGVRYEIAPVGTAHHLTRVYDRKGNQLSFAYEFGRLVSVTDASGRKLLFTWSAGYVSAITYRAANGEQLTTAYDVDPSTHRLRGVTHALGTAASRTLGYAYANGLTTVTDALGATTAVTYDSLKRVAAVDDRARQVWAVRYDQPVPVTPSDGMAATTVTNPEGDTKTYVTSKDEHNLVFIRDAGDVDVAGNSRQNDTTFTWTGNRLRRETDAVAVTKEYDWNDLGDIVETRLSAPDEVPVVTALAYNTLGSFEDLVDVRVAAGSDDERHTHYTHDQAGNVRTITDPMGAVTTVAYFPRGLVASVVDPEGRTTRFGDASLPANGYDASGGPVRIYDAEDRSTSIEYDFLGHAVRRVDRTAQTWLTMWDVRGNKLGEVSPTGAEMTYCYDANDNLYLTISPRSPSRTCSLEGRDGYSTRVTFDPRDRIREVVTASDGQIRKTVYEYDADGELAAVVEPRSFNPATGGSSGIDQRRRFVRYPNNRLKYSFDQQGHRSEIRYTGVGEVAWRSEPASSDGNKTVLYGYDKRGRLETELVAGHSTPSRFAYNLPGERIADTTPRGVTTLTGYDRNGRAITLTHGNGTVSATSYDRVGNVVAVTHPTGIGESMTTTYTYTPHNQIRSETDPADGNHVIWYEYDNEGRQTKKIDRYANADERVVEQRYRVDGFVEETDARFVGTNNGRHRSVFRYSPDGLLNSSSTYLDGSVLPYAEMLLDYTSAGELRAWTELIDGVSKSGTYEWTVDGLLAARSVDGTRTSYGYDTRGLPTRATDGSGPNYTWSYFPSGSVDRALLPNSGFWTYRYDIADRIRSAALAGGGRTLASWDSITYDDDDHRVSEVVAQEQVDGSRLTGTGEYGYDTLGRLIEYRHAFDDVVTPLELDNAGNVVLDNNTTYAYAANRLTRMQRQKEETNGAQGTDARETTTYEYDHFGNRVRTVVDGNVGTVSYDAANHTVNDNGVGGAYSVNYGYDAHERMVRRSDSTNTTRLFFHDGLSGQIVLETDMSGAAKKRYVLDAEGDPLAQVDLTRPGSSGTAYYVHDPRGNVVGLIDSTIDVVATYAYDAFGKTNESLSASLPGWDSRLRYQSAPRDPHSGTYALGPRLLDPSTNRFQGADFAVGSTSGLALQQDHLTGNRYLYAGANPVNMIDDGHAPCLFGKFGWCGKPKAGSKKTGPRRLWCTDSYRVWVCGEKDPGKIRTGWMLGPGAKDGWNAIQFDALIALTIIELQYSGQAPPAPAGGQAGVNLGRKLDYFFGRAAQTNAHNYSRSLQNLRQLERIGLRDTAQNRDYLAKLFDKMYRDPSSVLARQENGFMVREAVITGPNGVAKLETVWDGNKLITGIIYGNGSRYVHRTP